jgi:hypothetical protein
MFYYFFLLFSLITVGIFAWFYLFNIYEVKISVNPKVLSSNSYSEISVKAIALNSFGTKALFRNISAKFSIVSGSNLVSVVKQYPDEIVLKSKGKVGVVEIVVTPEYGLFPSKIKFDIIE